MHAEHSSKFAALHRQGRRLQMSENYRVGQKIPNKQTNKQEPTSNGHKLYSFGRRLSFYKIYALQVYI